MHENAVNDTYKSLALLRSAHNYRHRMKDNEKAAATYKAAIEVPKGHPNYKAEAYEILLLSSFLRKKMMRLLLNTINRLNLNWPVTGSHA